jgi:H(+)-transporting ATP synthase subunit D
MNLLRTARRLERVTQGGALLRRKREALVVELFRLARPATDARERIAAAAARAYPALLAALGQHGRAGLRALTWPGRDVQVELEPGSIWGIVISRIAARQPLARTLAARATAPGLTGPAAAHAAGEFERWADLLIEAAPQEMLIRRLGEALARTSRQVNMLERRLGPALRREVAEMRRALDQREREEWIRVSLMKSS